MSPIELVWDKKRILIGLVIFIVLITTSFYFAKAFVLEKKQNEGQKNKQGRVIGTGTKEEELIRIPSQEEFQEKIKTIQKEILELKPEDVTRQEPVKKIITELEILKKSTETQVVSGAKNAVCEEAKRIFCSQ